MPNTQDKWADKPLIRCMGGQYCKHAPGTCTSDPEYQAYIAQKREADMPTQDDTPEDFSGYVDTTQDDTLKPCPDMEAMVEALARHLTRADCDPFIMSEISIGLYADKRWHEKAEGAREMLTASGATALAQEVERLKAEMERRDENERRNCLNHGPCSRMSATSGIGGPDAAAKAELVEKHLAGIADERRFIDSKGEAPQ